MAANQQFCLKWNNHHSNLLNVFEALLHTEAFTDVTLAVDGASIKCHKMVLAACSPYLQTLLAEHVTTHPIVVLKDIRLHEMRALLEYMYRGEVNVAQEQLGSLLKVAETLQIKGLVEEGRWERHKVEGGGAERATIEPRQPCPDSNPAAELQKKKRRPQEVWCESNPILRTVLGHGGMSGLDVPSLMAAAMGREIMDREFADRQ
ncbi:protein tramtrack, beta isoform-like, partial [Pollicipes pollicipes]